MEKKLQWIIGIVLMLTLLVAGWAYGQIDNRIARNEATLDRALPILYSIEERVKNIERILQEQYNAGHKTKVPNTE